MNEKKFHIGPVSADPIALRNSRAFVKGRNCKGTVKIGDVFTTAAERKFLGSWSEAMKTGVFDPPIIDSNERKISLRVESIEAYGRRFESIDEGLTALLELSGIGLDQLLAEDLLICSS